MGTQKKPKKYVQTDGLDLSQKFCLSKPMVSEAQCLKYFKHSYVYIDFVCLFVNSFVLRRH